MTEKMPLQEEMDFFAANRGKWLVEHKGKFALIKGHELIDVFDTAENAYIEAVRRFGNVSVLIKQVLEKDPIIHMPALTLGKLRAPSLMVPITIQSLKPPRQTVLKHKARPSQ